MVECRGWPCWHVECMVAWVAHDGAVEQDRARGHWCQWHAQVQVVGEKALVGDRASVSNQHLTSASSAPNSRCAFQKKKTQQHQTMFSEQAVMELPDFFFLSTG